MSLLTSFSDFFKPHRGEAIIRIRNNSIGLLFLLILTNISPLPTIPSALRITKNAHQWGFWRLFCCAELAIMISLALNIVQGAYAIRYPRAPLPPLPSPAKLNVSPVTSPRRLTTLSPNSSPQPQKSFSASFSASGVYPSSPLSTPSRVLNYSIPPSSSTTSAANMSFNSSLSRSMPPTPSPLLSAYRGKRNGEVGRAFDGVLLGRLSLNDSDNDSD